MELHDAYVGLVAGEEPPDEKRAIAGHVVSAAGKGARVRPRIGVRHRPADAECSPGSRSTAMRVRVASSSPVGSFLTK
jgi:hypothetical protein